MVWSFASSFPWFFLFRRNRAILVLISGGWFSLLKHFLGGCSLLYYRGGSWFGTWISLVSFFLGDLPAGAKEIQESKGRSLQASSPASIWLGLRGGAHAQGLDTRVK